MGKPVLESKTGLDLNEARDDGVLGWQWHQLDHMQTICTSLRRDNHTNTPSLNFYRSDTLPKPNQQCQNHCKLILEKKHHQKRRISHCLTARQSDK